MAEQKGKEKEKAEAVEKKEPEGVALKDVAKQAGVEPREARAILRKLNIRGEAEKRQRWTFKPNEVAGVVSRIKAAKAAAEKAKAEKAAAAEEGEE